MRGPYEEPDEDCPYCGSTCSAPFVDIGVGMQQVGPYQCECGAVEAGPYDERLCDADPNTGWYQPEGWEPSEIDQGFIPIPEKYNEQYLQGTHMKTRQNITVTLANMLTRNYTGVTLLVWSHSEITFQHDAGYETLNRAMVLSTTLTTENVQ